MTWRLTEHTADIAIEATETDEGAALAAAGLALTSVMTGEDSPHRLGGEATMEFRIEAPDHDSLAVAFLAELLWLAESEGLLWAGGGVTVEATNDGWAARAGGNGVRVDDAPRAGVEVKAVTYHDLHSRPSREGWSLRVLLDI